ncbi:MAG TPA: hypothetical protein PKE39_06165 [Ignavibacteria bacterium]|nr:hypothetical protein [Ignavibacteria bacterium]
MNEHFRNMISMFVALIMLAGGNFTFALAHGDCLISSEMHITCEMECCKENPCITDDLDGEVEIADESNSCCKTHVDEALTGDVPLPVLANNSENLKSFGAVTGTEFLFSENSGFHSFIHKHKTTNILLITSVLRI